MSPQTDDGPAEEARSGSTLHVADTPAPTEDVRQVLSRFNHRCRNSLNGIKMSLYLFKREVDGPMPSDWLELEQSYQELEVLFDRLQMIYRPLSLTVVRSPVGRLIDEHLPSWRSWFSPRKRILELARPANDLPADFDPMQLGLGLDAFVAWRADSGPAGWKSLLSWRIADGFIELRWEESRPVNGTLGHDRDSGQPWGCRPNGRIESLAYPLLKRIIVAHGGSVETSDESKFVVSLRWPRFRCSEQNHQ